LWKKSKQWTVVDTETGLWKIVRATDQQEAWRRGRELGVTALKTDHVRPRTGDTELAPKKVFKKRVAGQLD